MLFCKENDITYCLFDLNILKVKGKPATLEGQVNWNGDVQVTGNLSDIDPREPLAAKNKNKTKQT